MKRKLFIIFIFIFFILFLFSSAYSYASSVSSNLSNNLLRLHIIANSNSDKDQKLKLEIRDSLIRYINTIVSTNNTKDEVTEILKSHINDMKEIALKEIYKNGFNYDVNINLEHINFPTKKYGNIKLPNGLYDAIDVHIGSSNGHNWWCVMFPPLCLVNDGNMEMSEESKNNLKENLSNEDYELITSKNQTYEFKFKIVELINNIKHK